MPAWLAPALMAGSGLLSAFGASKGADAAADASKMNYKINKENLEEQRKNREETIEQALKYITDARMGVTDAQGNRQYFDPERGWVTKLSPMQQIIADLVEREQIRQGSEGARRAAENEQRMSGMARDSAVRADAAGSEFDRVRKHRSRPLAEILMAAGDTERNRIADRQADAMATQQLRSGANTDLVSSQGARASSDAASSRDAMFDAILKAKEFTTGQYNAQRGAASELLKAFTQGSNYAPSYSMSAPTGPTSAQGGASNLQSQLLSAMSGTPQQDYVQPDYSQANKLTSIGSTLGGIGDWYSQWTKDQADAKIA